MTWPERVLAALHADRSPQSTGLTAAMGAAPPQPLADTGLAHHHLRLPGTGLLARLPKHSQMRLAPAVNLRYQAACFERAQASGHTPRLAGVLAPSAALPWGGLLVEEIIGRAPRLPADLPALMQALASLHALPVPAPAGRAPLLRAARPAARLLREIDAQAMHLGTPGVPAASRARIRALRSAWRAPRAALPAAARLIAFDAHPGNFLIRPSGQAVLVDLEKARYSQPALDVAHATLYTSTTWDVATRAVLTPEQVAQAYGAWLTALVAADAATDATDATDGTDAGAAAGTPADWLAWRQAMWLWSVTWCAEWLAKRAASTAGDDLLDHVHERVQHYLAPATVDQVLAEFDALPRLWGR